MRTRIWNLKSNAARHFLRKQVKLRGKNNNKFWKVEEVCPLYPKDNLNHLMTVNNIVMRLRFRKSPNNS